VKPEELGFVAGKLAVKDVKTGRTQQVAPDALADGSLITELDSYEYRLFEISPAK